MRRNATQLTLAAICAVISIALASAPGRAGERKPRARSIGMEVTAYCPCKKCCGAKAHGKTASGDDVSHNDGKFVAADSALPFGTRLIVPGYAGDLPVEVLDRGGAIKGRRIDVFFPTHRQALSWGRRKLDVVIFE